MERGEKETDGEETLNEMDYFLCVLGMVFVVEGLPYLAFPEKLKTYLRKLTDMPDRTLRIMGAVAVCIGLLLIAIGRS